MSTNVANMLLTYAKENYDGIDETISLASYRKEDIKKWKLEDKDA